ncbi:DUF3857 domain-containing protein [Flavivirga amylovorans]|uniref:DUF3857 domain-containing protein n=1 Tax=Flavivirga amylovorans TaxID=870486 RepID=A0ABT8X0I9_9FLAO|nr:DUF3857 domain-containing protein [Flavivirga amylovorans]MDO5987440.1 DUF3857 domain-containing protein [Flavivirga amylovorans]
MKITVILFSLCFTITAFAQDYKFGKVSKEELEEKFNPLDSSANATYLYKNRKTFFQYQQGEGFSLITEIHERIKIYNKDGFDYATENVGLYKNGSDIEEFTNIKAYTYNLLEGKVEETKLTKEGIFKTEKYNYLDEVKFTMPNIKEGSVVEFKYRITSPFYSNVDDFDFQYSIPVKKLEAKFEVPEYFVFKPNMKGFLSVIPKTETKRDKITFRSKTRSGGGLSSGASTSYSSSDVEFTKSISSFNLKDVPALKEEPYVNSINNYRSSMKYELSYTKFPQSTVKYYSTTWEDVVKTIYKSPNFGDELNKTNYYEDELDAIIGSVSGAMERTSLIFNFVKSRVKWNGRYGKYTNEGVKKAFKDHVGNVAEINLMLTSMLKYAGLNAYPVLVSTRRNGVPLFPTREGYNYVVSYVKFSDGYMLLDATSKYSVPNVLPFRTLNWQGRVISDKGGSTLVNLYPKNKSKDNVFMMVNLNEDGSINGGCRSLKTSHDALRYRERYNNKDEEDFIEKLENKYNGLEISDFKVTNGLDLSKPVTESYKFIKESQADIIGDKIYFSPMFYLRTMENPFKLENREFPVDFGYPSTSRYQITINLPEEYKVESIPESVAFSLPDNLGVFKFNIVNSGLSIQLVVNVDINQSIVTPLYYDALKEYFKQMIEKENEQIVLTRI